MRTIVLLCFLAMARIAAAQNCTGGLGDPIVDITFGAGAGFGAPLPWVTHLTYQAADCPPDGYYTITNHTNSCFGHTWWQIDRDHTGDPNGYFMLINASYDPSDFYIQTVNGLCGGTSYQFAAWVMNVDVRTNQIKSNVTFTISKTDGTLLNSGNTGDIPGGSETWQQYAFYFTTPPGVSSVILKMTNNAPGGIGNDLAIDDITFRTAGSSVQLNAAGFAGDSVQVCDYAQTTMNFNAKVASCYPSQDLQWQTSLDKGASWSDISGAKSPGFNRVPTGPGQFEYRLLVAQAGNLGITSCEVASKPMVITVVPKPAPAVSIASSASVACIGIPVHFDASPVDGGNKPSYQWMVNDAAAGRDSTGLTVVTPPSGLVVKAVMTSDAVCVQNPKVNSNTITLNPIPVPAQRIAIDASATSICQDSLVNFVAVGTNSGASPAYQWQVNGVNAGMGPDFSDGRLKNGDVVNCIMTGSLVCSQPVSAPPVTMTVWPLPTVSLDSVAVIAGGSDIRLAPKVTGDVVGYSWTPETGLDNPFAATPLARPAVTTAYQVYVVTNEGCRAGAEELVEVYYPLRMPAAFTPNGDGRNDLFRVPVGEPVRIRSLAVYNREGMRVFATSNAAAGWDGRYNGVAQPSGTYVWELVFENPVTKKLEGQKGTVVLVR